MGDFCLMVPLFRSQDATFGVGCRLDTLEVGCTCACMGTEMVDGDGDGMDRSRDGSNAGGAEADSHVRGSVGVSLPPCKVQGKLDEREEEAFERKRASQDFG